MAEDRVQSEPLSSQFPLTGNKTEKFSAFAQKSPQASPLSRWICALMAVLSDVGLLEQGIIIDQLSGNDHSLMGYIGQPISSSSLTRFCWFFPKVLR
jgi:hypothetical protein